MSTLNDLLASGKYHDLFAILKGFRNGAVYGIMTTPKKVTEIGAKIRFPHALVMTLLFRRSRYFLL